ncbi:MAG: PHP domain-containing protein [Thermodesulfovibrionales bacterium]|nr:PHP domain-containing protein [Thermodesulfovibrionales bacterium]
MIIDMHVHTRFSPCSVMRITQLLQSAKKKGLNGVCITDHDTTGSSSALRNIQDEYGVSVIVGIEYTTKQGDFLVFGPVEFIPKGSDAEGLLRWTEKEGCIAIPAHPFRKNRPSDMSILKSFGIIELLNGRNQPSENEACRVWIEQQGNGTRTIGGSDAHTTDELGRAVTIFEKDIFSSEDLIRELRYGRYAPRSMYRR